MIAGSVGVGKGGSPPLTRTRDVLLSRRHALLRLDVSLQAMICSDRILTWLEEFPCETNGSSVSLNQLLDQHAKSYHALVRTTSGADHRMRMAETLQTVLLEKR